MVREGRTAAIIAQILMGAWLVVSAFWWPHSAEQFVIALMGGLLCGFFAVGAIGRPRRGSGSYLVAVLLLAGSVFLPALKNLTLINHVILALAIVVCSHFQSSAAALARG